MPSLIRRMLTHRLRDVPPSPICWSWLSWVHTPALAGRQGRWHHSQPPSGSVRAEGGSLFFLINSPTSLASYLAGITLGLSPQ